MKALFVMLLAFILNVNLSAQDYSKAMAFKDQNGLALLIENYTPGLSGFDSERYFKKTGKYEVIVRAVIVNTSGEVIHVSPLYFKAVSNRGYTLTTDASMYGTKNPFSVVSLEPGTRTEGFLVFGLSNQNDYIDRIIYDDNLGHRVSRTYEDANNLQKARRAGKYKP